MAFEQRHECSVGINYDDIRERVFLAQGTARANNLTCEHVCCVFSIPTINWLPYSLCDLLTLVTISSLLFTYS